MIYNVGFHLYLGVGCSIALSITGLLLSAILPLLKSGDTVAAYFALMAIVTFVAVPMLSYAGYMDNLNSLVVLLVLVLTESFFGEFSFPLYLFFLFGRKHSQHNIIFQILFV